MKRAAAKMTTSTEERRCAIYTRKSTSAGLDQEFNSLDAQREACLAYIERQKGWKVVDARYDDGGFTGANLDRPAFQRLLDDIAAGQIDIVVVYKVDRLSRSLLDFVRVMERFNAAGASFVSVTQNFSTADAMGRLTLNMLMSFAEFEREMIAERTRDKIAASRRKGKWTGGPVPFGYDVKDKRLVVNELEAIIVREAFELFVMHRRMVYVARTLNERGALPRAPRRPVRPRWTKDSIARVLKNPIYAGLVRLGDELHTGEHPALIDDATWRRARRLLDTSHRPFPHRRGTAEYLLRGVLRCGRCGAAMSPASTRKGEREYRYYRCCARDKNGTCESAPVPAAAIEGYVVERLSDALTLPGLAEEAKTALDERIGRKRTVLEAERARLPGRIATANANASRYAEELMRAEGRAHEILQAKLHVEGEALERDEHRLATVKRELAALADEQADAEWVTQAMAEFSTLWDVLTIENRERLLKAIVERVVVDDHSERIELHLIDFGSDSSARSSGDAAA